MQWQNGDCSVPWLPRLTGPMLFTEGRYAQALARTSTSGTWLDVPLCRRLAANWEAIQDRLIAEIDPQYGVYEGRTFTGRCPNGHKIM